MTKNKKNILSKNVKDFNIVSFSYPSLISKRLQNNKKFKKRYEINLFINPNGSKKISKKKIMFGLNDKDEFIDHKNTKLK